MLQTASQIHHSSQAFADGQNTLSGTIVDPNLSGRLNDVAVMTEAADILDPIRSECARIGIDPVDLISSKLAIYDRIRGLPSRRFMSELRRVRLRNPQQEWERNDLNDYRFCRSRCPIVTLW